MRPLHLTAAGVFSGPAGNRVSFVEHVSHDVAEQASHLSGWDQRYEQLSAGRFEGHTTEIEFSNLQVFRERTNCSLQESCRSRDNAFVIGVPVSMDGPGWCSGWEVDNDTVLLNGPGRDVLFRTPRQLDLIAVSMAWDELVQHAQLLHGDGLPSGMKTEAQALRNPAIAAEIRALLISMLGSVTASPGILDFQAVRDGLKEGILSTVISVFGNAPTASAAPRTSMGRQMLIHRAIEYMRSRIDEPISVSEVCEALCVSQRTLQYCFEEVLQTNPVAYLKALRLNGVRNALRRADPTTTAVQDVAASWGFWHLSRFAQEYRLMFGELPSETLRARLSLQDGTLPLVTPRRVHH